jgi:hypothetical protein
MKKIAVVTSVIALAAVAALISVSNNQLSEALESDKSVAAFKRGDYATAVKIAQPLAERGDAVNQRHLGYLYEEGKGVPQSDAEAIRWYRKAADQGDAEAERNLGLMYAYGKGVPLDVDEAAKWFRKAADQGNQDSKDSLARLPNIVTFKDLVLDGNTLAQGNTSVAVTGVYSGLGENIGMLYGPTHSPLGFTEDSVSLFIDDSPRDVKEFLYTCRQNSETCKVKITGRMTMCYLKINEKLTHPCLAVKSVSAG